MSDEPKIDVPGPVDDVPATEPVPDVPVPDPVPEPPKVDSDGDGIPDWGKELMKKVEDIAAVVAAPIVDPGSDENPVKPPWTHRKFM